MTGSSLMWIVIELIESNSLEEMRVGVVRQVVLEWAFVRFHKVKFLYNVTSNYSSHCFIVCLSLTESMEQRVFTLLVI
jgi:hypothetical protein